MTDEIRPNNLFKKVVALREENKSLKKDNDFLQKQNRACKLRCGQYAIRVRELEEELKDLKFTKKYLSSEKAGKQFARELLGKPMTDSDIAEAEFIANGEALYEATWNINGGDDF